MQQLAARSTSLLSAIAYLTLLAAPARAEVLVVDSSGGAEFREIQAAVDAAVDGDTLLVRAGNYVTFVVDDKDLRILAQAGSPVESGTLRVRNLGAGKALVISGLHFAGSPSTSGSIGHGAWLVDNSGAIRLQDCTIDGADGAFGLSIHGWSALLVQSCADVMMVECTLRGGTGLGGQFSPPPGDGGAGLELEASQLALLESELTGGDGGWIVANFWNEGGAAGPGAVAQGSYLFCSRSILVGGVGGDCAGFGSGCGADGGAGLVLDASQVGADLHAAQLTGGLGGPGCDDCDGAHGPGLVDPAGIASNLSGPEHGFDAPIYGGESSPLAIEVTGTPGDRVLLMAAVDPDFLPRPEWRGVIGLDSGSEFALPAIVGVPPLEKHPSVLGVIPASGVLNLDLTIGALPDGAPASTLFLQTLEVGPAGVSLSEPRALTVFSCDASLPDCDDDGITDLCEIGAGAPDADGNGIPDGCDSSRLHVREDAPPGGDGGSWATALSNLEDALERARDSEGLVEEIWLAEGRYVPAGILGFHPVSGVALYGGFEGDEVQLSERDHVAHPTILSGDLAGDDLPGFLNRDDNSIRVIGADNFPPTFDLRVDGFVISGGYSGYGAGCALATDGLVVANCRFTDNWTDSQGAGLSVSGSGTAVVNCRFEGNHAQGSWAAEGGGLRVASDGDVTVVNCVFTGNRARLGGGMYIEGSSRPGASVTVVDCTFFRNVGGEQGGGIYAEGDDLPIFSLTNSILWDNRVTSAPTVEEEQIFQPSPAASIVSYSCIDGLSTIPGPGNIALNPSFVFPLGLDGDPGTADDDLHLRPASPCIDAGRNPAVPPDQADLDLDGDSNERTPLDFDLLARFVDDPAVPDTGSGQPPLVDMGAHERP